MQSAEYVQANRCLLVRTGSHLYGTASAESDEDFAGIVLPTQEYVFGMQRLEQIDLSKVSKGEDGRNTADAVDVVYYELRKFARLALDCNPNVLELLFAPPEHQIYMTGEGAELLLHADLFPHQGALQKFTGYARSQRHKMQIRSGNYDNLRVVEEALTRLEREDPQATLKDIQYRHKTGTGLSWKASHAQAGDLSLQYHLKVGKALRKVSDRLAKATHRSGLMDRYGFDTKFGSHLLRLLMEGIELFETGRITFPLAQADYLRDVKEGVYTMEAVLERAEHLEERLCKVAEHTLLPRKPRTHEVERLVIDLVRRHVTIPG